jgi:hypothetical protein
MAQKFVRFICATCEGTHDFVSRADGTFNNEDMRQMARRKSGEVRCTHNRGFERGKAKPCNGRLREVDHPIMAPAQQEVTTSVTEKGAA